MVEELTARRAQRMRRIIGFLLLGLLAHETSVKAESVRVESRTLNEAHGEAGATPILVFTIGDLQYRALDAREWKWMSNCMGFDVGAIGAPSGVAVIGLRVEKIEDGKGGSFERMSEPAIAALRKKWDDAKGGGDVKILAFEASPEGGEVAVRFRRSEEGRELEGYERSFFNEGKLITLGMLADENHLGLVQSMFAQFNGSFERWAP